MSDSTTTPSTNSSEHPQPEPAEVSLTANADSITELFARDPLEWSDADMNRMVEHYRKERIKLDSMEVKVKGAKKSATPKIAMEDLKGKDGEGLLGALGIDL